MSSRQVTFRSDAFPPYEDEEKHLNPGVWGKRLATFLALRLAEEGLLIAEPIAEDWGWLVPIEGARVPMGVACGHQDGDDDEFLCFVVPERAQVRKGLRRVDISTELDALHAALATVLTAAEEVRDVVWEDAG